MKPHLVFEFRRGARSGDNRIQKTHASSGAGASPPAQAKPSLVRALRVCVKNAEIGEELVVKRRGSFFVLHISYKP